MGKRFIETELWQEERFLDSSIEQKLLTVYLFTNCNYIGLFKKSLRLVSFEVGFTVTKDEILDCPLDIEQLKDGRFWLSSFCSFQYGDLKEACRPHRKYISELKKEGLLERVSKGYQKGINTLEEQEQDKEQDKDIDKEQVKAKEKASVSIFENWNSQLNTTTHRTHKQDVESAYNSLLKDNYTEGEILIAIDSYNQALGTDESWLDHKWTLKEFLTREGACRKFIDCGGDYNWLKKSQPNGRVKENQLGDYGTWE